MCVTVQGKNNGKCDHDLQRELSRQVAKWSERLAWKVFQLYHLSQASQVHAVKGCAAFSGQHFVQYAQYSCHLQWPARLSVYVAAFGALHPHLLNICLLDVVTAHCPVSANHDLQRELSRQVAKWSEVDDDDSEARCDEGDDARNASGSGVVLARWPGQSETLPRCCAALLP